MINDHTTQKGECKGYGLKAYTIYNFTLYIRNPNSKYENGF